MRHTERALVTQYQQLMRQALGRLTPDNADTVVRMAELPQSLRGYEHITMVRVDEYREQAREALRELTAREC